MKNSLRAAALTFVLTTAACVQTEEFTLGYAISIDPRLTYGKALPKQMARARNAIRANPDDPAPHYFLGKAYMSLNDLDAAQNEFQAIITLSPDSAGAYFELAQISAVRGDYAKAREQVERAIELDPEYPLAHKLADHIYEMLGHLKALEAQRKAESEP